jgi:hypothetical protein
MWVGDADNGRTWRLREEPTSVTQNAFFIAQGGHFPKAFTGRFQRGTR